MAGSRLTIVGRVLRHIMGVLLLCWLRALKWGAIAGLAGVMAAEVAAIVVTRSFPPDGLAQVVAFAVGGALAFGVAVTVIADELVVGVIETVRMLVGEAEAGARAGAMVARRDVGESSGRVLALLGLGGIAAAGATRRPAPSDMLPAPPRAAQGPQDEVGPRLQALRDRVPASSASRPAAEQTLTPENPWAAALTPVGEWPAEQAEDATPPAAASESGAAETLAELAAPPAAVGEPNPATQPLARPVHATNLPRIDWAVEEPPPLPPEPAPETGAGPFGAPSATTRPMTGAADAPALAEPSVWHIYETMPATPERWHDPAQAAEPEPEEAGITPVDLFGAPPPAVPPAPPLAGAAPREPDAGTRPLPEKTRPLESSDLVGRPRGSVWDHISQVLAGRPVPPIPSEDELAADDLAENDSSGPGIG